MNHQQMNARQLTKATYLLNELEVGYARRKSTLSEEQNVRYLKDISDCKELIDDIKSNKEIKETIITSIQKNQISIYKAQIDRVLRMNDIGALLIAITVSLFVVLGVLWFL